MSTNLASSDHFDPFKVKMCAQSGTSFQNIHPQLMAKQTTNEGKQRLRAAFLRSAIWGQNSTILIGFLEDPPTDLDRTPLDVLQKSVDKNGVSLPIDPLQFVIDQYDVKTAVIKTITERLQPIVNIKLQFYDANQKLLNPSVCDVRISFDPTQGAFSLVGTQILGEKDKKKCTMNLGWFDVPTTLHEFCHALGMIHEHQNPNGNQIDWDIPRVLNWALSTQGWDRQTTETNIIQRYKHDEINGSSYDPTSIMLYFFPSSIVDDPKTGRCCGQSTQQNLQFSPYDVLFLNNTYPLPNSNLTPDQFTVKFFNDVFNKQINIADLQKQLQGSASNWSSLTTIPTSPSISASQHALRQNDINSSSTEAPMSKSNDYNSYLMPVIMLILVILLLFIFLGMLYFIVQMISKRKFAVQ